MASNNPQPFTQNISNVGTTTPPNAATANRDIPIDQPSCLADALSNRFCNDCKYGCKETAQKIRITRDETTSTITNATKTQHNNYEIGKDQYCKQFVLMCHTAGKQYQLSHPVSCCSCVPPLLSCPIQNIRIQLEESLSISGDTGFVVAQWTK